MKANLNVGFVGNPNCGKTTLFNAYTGAKLKVANWPGVTVEKKEGAMRYHDNTFKLVDLPGTYGLSSYTMEEQLTRQYILGDEVDVIIDVADASNLERNLYLTLQLIELGKPVVLALNMMDIVTERGMEIDMHRLPEMLGIPVIPVSARHKTGLDILMHAVAHHKENKVPVTEHQHKSGDNYFKHEKYVMVYSDEIEERIDIIKAMLKKKYPDLKNTRWHAIKILENDREIREEYPLNTEGITDKKYEKAIINEKYDFIQEIIEEVMVNRNEKAALTDKVDKYLTSNIFGIPIFLGIMALVFFLTFTIGDVLKGWMEYFLSAISDKTGLLLDLAGAGTISKSLIIEGIIGGVGGILSFLPNIFILFLALAFLEDSGYMSRVAYVMDGIMGKIGLSGRAFIPMLLGFGCTVPAVLASRALENPKDKLRTILVTPFMSCSARLPIYVMFSHLFFGNFAMLAAFSMYVLGIVIAILAAYIMKKISKESNTGNLLIELPEYKKPNKRTISIYVWEKVKDYITRAGTTIFVASVIIWALLNFGPSGYTKEMSESFGSYIGKFITPIFKPTGLGQWQVVLSLISGIAAKEVVVSSITVLCQGNVSGVLTAMGFGPLNAYALMAFCLLYVPCAASIVIIRKETNSAKWTLVSVMMQLSVAYIVATIIYQVGSLVL
ncbi:MAG: ferrous iron transport protein B [Bacillota bacterium]|nr:ferrous iron transport protein B [Bacillota bacterium]